MKKVIMFSVFILLCLLMYAESVVMVFPQDEEVIVIFDDHSWYYHSEISWYDSIDFVHYDIDSGFSILEEKSYLSKDNGIVIKGTAMNTSMTTKNGEVSYAILDSQKNIVSTGKIRTTTPIEPGNIFPFTITLENIEDAKYISFEYIMEVD